VSEIKLYNEKAVNRGYANFTLYDLLGDEIDRSWSMYKKRVGTDFAARYDYFHEELERVLAAGDSARFGPNYLASFNSSPALKYNLCLHASAGFKFLGFFFVAFSSGGGASSFVNLLMIICCRKPTMFPTSQ